MIQKYHSSNIDLALILPCYNPYDGWEKGIAALYSYLLKKFEITIAVVIVNDGSTNVLNKASISQFEKDFLYFIFLENQQNRGKGRSLRKGVKAVEAKFYIYTDFDLPFLSQNIVEVYKKLVEGFDVVTSTRGEEYWQKLSIQRKLLSQICSKMNRRLLKLRFPDAQAGLKGFNDSGKKVFLQTTIDRYLFDTEFILLAERHGNMRITAVDVQLQDDADFSNMSLQKSLPELRNYLGLLLRKW